jgi:hypothetical protein
MTRMTEIGRLRGPRDARERAMTMVSTTLYLVKTWSKVVKDWSNCGQAVVRP